MERDTRQVCVKINLETVYLNCFIPSSRVEARPDIPLQHMEVRVTLIVANFMFAVSNYRGGGEMEGCCICSFCPQEGW